MKTTEKTKSLAEMKKVINARLGNIQSRLITAKNDYFLCICYNEMLEILDAEIEHWLKLRDEHLATFVRDEEPGTFEGTQHIADLSTLRDTIHSYRERSYPNALIIQKAMQNTHVQNMVILPPL